MNKLQPGSIIKLDNGVIVESKTPTQLEHDHIISTVENILNDLSKKAQEYSSRKNEE